MAFSKWIANLVVAALVAATGLTSAAKAETVWKGYTYVHTATMASFQGLDRVAKAVEEATGGELKIVMNVGGSLPVKTSNITQAVGENILQFGSDGFYLGNVPIAGVMRLPMLMSNDEEFETALEIMAPYIEAAFAEKGVQVLAHYRYPIQVAWSTKEMTSRYFAGAGQVRGSLRRFTGDYSGR
jgi:TRAP-type C4-dicarboxylate transport system substrate-binding protein